MSEGEGESFGKYIEEYESIIETINSLYNRMARMERENPYYKKVLDFYQKFIVPLNTPEHYIVEVYRFFQKLRPFAHRKAVIRIEDDVLGYYDALAIGSDIRAGFYSGLCRKRRKGEVLNESRFVEVVTKYYEKIVPHLRKPIQESFEELAKLAGELELNLIITQRCDGYFLYSKIYREIINFVRVPCKVVSISMENPLDEVKIVCDKDIYYRRITRYEDLFALYKPIYEAYRKFYNEWSKIQKKNDEILKKMRKVLGEYALVNNL